MYYYFCVWFVNFVTCCFSLFSQTPFWPHKFGFNPLLGLEPMAPIRPQLLVSHANHSATETSIKIMFNIRGDQKPRGPPLTCLTLWANLALASMYCCMTTSMYCLYVGVDYTYIDVNALAQGIKSFLASQVCMYVCMYVCIQQ